VEQFTGKFKVDSVYHFLQKQPDDMFVNGSMNYWSHWFVHICAFCTLHFALCTKWFCVIVFLLQWVASYDRHCAFLAALHFASLLTVSTAVLLYCGEETFSLSYNMSLYWLWRL